MIKQDVGCWTPNMYRVTFASVLLIGPHVALPDATLSDANFRSECLSKQKQPTNGRGKHGHL